MPPMMMERQATISPPPETGAQDRREWLPGRLDGQEVEVEVQGEIRGAGMDRRIRDAVVLDVPAQVPEQGERAEPGQAGRGQQAGEGASPSR